jgi:hypothetical protein
MERMVPWRVLYRLIAPFYAKPGNAADRGERMLGEMLATASGGNHGYWRNLLADPAPN